jgi:hypothetical protein
MIYGYIGDELFRTAPTIEVGESSLPPVCYLDDTIENYFETRLTVTDVRETRINPAYTGKIRLYMDASKLAEDHIFTKLTEEERNLLFEIIEKIYTAEDTSLAVLEEELTTDPRYSVVYIQESLRLGTRFTGTGIPADGIGPKTMRDYIQFEIALGSGTEQFKFWMSRVTFASDYPLSTISEVVMPCNAATLLNPGQVSNTVDAIIQSTTISLGMLDPKVVTGDHSGVLVYNTKYIINSNTVKMMPFGILYKGAKPSTLEIRKAIREKILSYGLATKEVWEAILPDLFVTGQFYVIPIWPNTTVRPDRVMYPSALKLKSIETLLPTMFPNVDPDFLTRNWTIVTCAASEIFLIFIADPLNESAFDFLALHPTYQFYPPSDAKNAYMEQKTREFALKLSRCMGVLLGETLLDEFAENVFDGRTYLSFVSTGIEYHVLNKSSYPTL